MKKQNKNFAYDYKDKTIRGSFINQVLLGIYVFLIFYGVMFSDVVINRIVKIAEFMVAIFAISYGVWRTGQYFTKKNINERECSDEEERKALEEYEKAKGE